MIFCPQLPSPGILNTHCTLTTVRYGTPRLTLSSRRGGFKTLLIPFSIGPLCGDLSFPLQNVSALFLLDGTYLFKASRYHFKIQSNSWVCILTADSIGRPTLMNYLSVAVKKSMSSNTSVVLHGEQTENLYQWCTSP